jgi:hypothetical protein
MSKWYQLTNVNEKHMNFYIVLKLVCEFENFHNERGKIELLIEVARLK